MTSTALSQHSSAKAQPWVDWTSVLVGLGVAFLAGFQLSLLNRSAGA